MPPNGGLLVLGPSGSGKSTLLAHLRDVLASESDVCFPVRLTTRPPRSDDRDWENRSVSLARFEEVWAASGMMMRWSKVMPERDEHYGFETADAAAVVLGGNDAIVANRRSLQERYALADRLDVAFVWCEPEVRLKRLLARSPELAQREAELLARLQLDARELIPDRAITIDTSAGLTAGVVGELANRVVTIARAVEES